MFAQSGRSIHGATNMMYLPVTTGMDPYPKQGGTNRQETVKKTLENPLVTRDLQNFSVCQMGFKS